MQTKKTIYAIVRYPKTLKDADYFDFNIYTYQTSNLDKMSAYLDKLQKTWANSGLTLALVTRETAKQMRKTWGYHMRHRVAPKPL